MKQPETNFKQNEIIRLPQTVTTRQDKEELTYLKTKSSLLGSQETINEI